MAVVREDANLRTLREARAAMEEVPKFYSSRGEHGLPGKGRTGNGSAAAARRAAEVCLKGPRLPLSWATI